MAHDNAIRSLNGLMKVRLGDIGADEMATALGIESARALVVLVGSMIDDVLRDRLLKAFGGNLNSDERSAMFDFSGPLGPFSARIKVAAAIGIVSKSAKNDLELIRAMRNAAAHSLRPFEFTLPELQAAVLALHDRKFHETMKAWDHIAYQQAFLFTGVSYAARIGEVELFYTASPPSAIIEYAEEGFQQREASRKRHFEQVAADYPHPA